VRRCPSCQCRFTTHHPRTRGLTPDGVCGRRHSQLPFRARSCFSEFHRDQVGFGYVLCAYPPCEAWAAEVVRRRMQVALAPDCAPDALPEGGKTSAAQP